MICMHVYVSSPDAFGFLQNSVIPAVFSSTWPVSSNCLFTRFAGVFPDFVDSMA